MNCIVAVDENWAIGKGNSLIYYLPEDLKSFKEKTIGKIIVCGRKTLESFPGSKPLPNRVHFVLSHAEIPSNESLKVFANEKDLLQEISRYDPDFVYLCGGESVYKLLLPYCEKAFVTKIAAKTDDATAFFPNLDLDPEFVLSEESEELISKSGLHYKFTVYKKK